jgi:hypothetical protein
MAPVRASVSVYDPETCKSVGSVPVPAVLTVSRRPLARKVALEPFIAHLAPMVLFSI